MTARTQILNAIKHLGPRELLKVADFIEALQTMGPGKTQTVSDVDYRAVRDALSGLSVPMSTEIDRGREDRL